MKTFCIIIQYYFVEFHIGVLLLVAGLFGAFTWEPDRPEAPYRSLVGMLGPYIFWGFAIIGFTMLLYVWRGGRRLK